MGPSSSASDNNYDLFGWVDTVLIEIPTDRSSHSSTKHQLTFYQQDWSILTPFSVHTAKLVNILIRKMFLLDHFCITNWKTGQNCPVLLLELKKWLTLLQEQAYLSLKSNLTHQTRVSGAVSSLRFFSSSTGDAEQQFHIVCWDPTERGTENRDTKNICKLYTACTQS